MAQTKPIICIIGAGRTGRILVDRLVQSWQLIVIDSDINKLNQLPDYTKNTGVEISTLQGDATSLLVLEDAGVSGAYQTIITINNDRAAKEVVNLLVSRLGLKNIYARVNNETTARELRRKGIYVVTPFETMANLIVNQMNLGETIALNIGKGEGEIVQLELTRSSPIVGKPLHELPPGKPWLIGAIYRPRKRLRIHSAMPYYKKLQITKEDELIIPDGASIPRVGDKIILIGDPNLLRATAQYLKAGAPVFPLRHGNLVVTLLLDKGKSISGYKEFKWLLANIEPTSLHYIYNNDETHRMLERMRYPENWMSGNNAYVSKYRESLRRASGLIEHWTSSDRIGLVIYKEPKSRWSRALHRLILYPGLFHILHKNVSPLWIIRGKKPVDGIALFVSSARGSIAAAELAVDAATKFQLPVRAIQVNPPPELMGDEAVREQRGLMDSIREMAALYGITIQEVILTGNPVYETLKSVTNRELLVIPYPRYEKRRFLRPPSSEKLLVKKFTGSTLLLSV